MLALCIYRSYLLKDFVGQGGDLLVGVMTGCVWWVGCIASLVLPELSIMGFAGRAGCNTRTVRQVAVGFAVHMLQVDLCVARVCQWTCSDCQRVECCSSHVCAARALCVPSLWPDGPTSVVVHLAWAQLLQQL